jgi:hypothetical protein
MTKLAHFIALTHPYTSQSVVEAFITNVFKLHGPPASIITDRDKVFTSNMWQAVIKSLKVKLKLSTAYPSSNRWTIRESKLVLGILLEMHVFPRTYILACSSRMVVQYQLSHSSEVSPF